MSEPEDHLHFAKVPNSDDEQESDDDEAHDVDYEDESSDEEDEPCNSCLCFECKCGIQYNISSPDGTI